MRQRKSPVPANKRNRCLTRHLFAYKEKNKNESITESFFFVPWDVEADSIRNDGHRPFWSIVSGTGYDGIYGMSVVDRACSISDFLRSFY